MLQDVVSIRLPVDETFRIRKNVIRHGEGKRICIVTGIHGDELEGQYVCFLLARMLQRFPELLHGSVEIYPAVNPLGIDSIQRGIPGFDLDMNRTFPGHSSGVMTEFVAQKLVDDLAGADVVFDIHASNIFLTEVPQIRINELHRDQLLPLAEQANMDFIWIHGASTVLESTLAYSLNSIGTPCLVVEMGVGMRLTGEYGQQLTNGILNVMKMLGMWDGTVPAVRQSILSDKDDEVVFLNATCSGMFMKTKNQGTLVKKGETVGYVFDPLRGEVLEYVNAGKSGLLFTIREYPLVEEGSLMGRILVRNEKHLLPLLPSEEAGAAKALAEARIRETLQTPVTDREADAIRTTNAQGRDDDGTAADSTAADGAAAGGAAADAAAADDGAADAGKGVAR